MAGRSVPSYWWHCGSGSVELSFTRSQLDMIANSGRNDEQIEMLLRVPSIQKQLAKYTPDQIRAVVRESFYDLDEAALADDEANKARLLWDAVHSVKDEHCI